MKNLNRLIVIACLTFNAIQLNHAEIATNTCSQASITKVKANIRSLESQIKLHCGNQSRFSPYSKKSCEAMTIVLQELKQRLFCACKIRVNAPKSTIRMPWDTSDQSLYMSCKPPIREN